MNASILKEYLIALGFKVDEAGFKKFNVGLSTGTKAVLGFAAAATTMAVAVGTGVQRVARKFEELYYLSQRTRASVENINALGYAFSQLGGNADQAKGAVSALSDFMKLLPGGESVIRGFGVQTRGANGELRDTVDILFDLARRWRGMDFAYANVEAGMLGIDTETLRVLTRDTDRFFADYKARTRELGVDQEKAAEASRRLMQTLRDIWSVVVILADALLLKAAPALDRTAAAVRELYDRFLTWNAGSSESRRAVGELMAAVLALLGAVLQLAQAIWRVAGPALTEFAKGAVGVVTDVLGTLAHLIRTITALLRGDWASAWAEAKEVAGGVLKTLIDTAMTLWRTVRRAWYAITHRGADMPADEAASPAAGAAQGASAGATGATPTGTPIKQALDYFRSAGWSPAQAAGIVANLQSESGLRIGAVGDGGKAFGIAQWHPDRQAAFRRWAGKDIRQSTLAEQLAFVNYELTQGSEQAAGRRLRAATSARAAGSIVSAYYERPADKAREMAERGALAERLFGAPALRGSAPATSLAQTTTIIVQGQTDPAATGREIAALQGRVNADMVRNLKVAAS